MLKARILRSYHGILTSNACRVGSLLSCALGAGDEPYEALIPGGKSGEFYDEMCNYFYLAQLRAQVRPCALDIVRTGAWTAAPRAAPRNGTCPRALKLESHARLMCVHGWCDRAKIRQRNGKSLGAFPSTWFRMSCV